MHSEPETAHVFSCYDDADCGGTGTPHRHVPTRGIAWVLRWAAALAVLFFSCGVLTEFAYCLVAEHTVVRAARAGALEAMLPRATTKTITESIAQRLAGYPSARGQTRLEIHQNGRPILGRLKMQPGDRIGIHVAVPSSAVLPRWLDRLKFWHGNPPIEASAERQVPGRTIIAGRR
jgi:hypothetical protein